MIRYEYHPWLQPVPLPPLAPDKKPTEQDALPAKADPAAALPATGQSPPLPLGSQYDEYQWRILL
jgi:hypothetical protein